MGLGSGEAVAVSLQLDEPVLHPGSIEVTPSVERAQPLKLLSRSRSRASTAGRLSRPRAAGVPDRLLDVDQVAEMLAVEPSTVYQWAYKRRLPVVKLFGPHGALRFKLSAIQKLIAASERPALRPRAEEIS